MEKSVDVEKYLYDLYSQKTNEKMDEMKMHKLMYFVQRESLMVEKEILFDEPFYAWKYGPVLFSVRNAFKKPNPYKYSNNSLEGKVKELLNNVFEMYGLKSSWSLSSLSHNELSWKEARKGLAPDENGNVKLNVKYMQLDALREKLYRS